MEDISITAERLAERHKFTRRTCAYCDGTGIPKREETLGGKAAEEATCRSCDGRGHVWQRRNAYPTYSDEGLVRQLGEL